MADHGLMVDGSASCGAGEPLVLGHLWDTATGDAEVFEWVSPLSNEMRPKPCNLRVRSTARSQKPTEGMDEMTSNSHQRMKPRSHPRWGRGALPHFLAGMDAPRQLGCRATSTVPGRIGS